MATVFLNGRFVSRDEALVSAFDAGFQHGVGLFETMLALRGPTPRVLHLHEHIARLHESARALGLSENLRAPALEEAVRRTAEQAFADLPGVARLRLRLTITGGDLNMLARGGATPADPGLMIVAQPATEYPAEMFARGVLATIADMRANPFDPTQGHKTLNYWARLRDLQAAGAKGAGEALVFSVTNHLAGACVSNAFVVREGVLMTPIARGEEEDVAMGPDTSDPNAPPPARRSPGAVLPSPVLAGIARRWVMDWALAEGLECRRRMVTLDDILRADEVFLTNSSWGVLPVVRVEAENIADGRPGAITARLVSAWADLTRE